METDNPDKSTDLDRATAAGKLDLGLGVLLAGSSVVDPPPVDAPAAVSNPSAAISVTLQQLAEKREWRAIVHECEAQPAHGDDALLVRAWWLRAQIELAELPLGVLIAPLDSLTDALLRGGALGTEARGDELRGLIVPMMEQVCGRLVSDGEWDFSIALLERFQRIAPTKERELQELVRRLRAALPGDEQLRLSRLLALSPSGGLAGTAVHQPVQSQDLAAPAVTIELEQTDVAASPKGASRRRAIVLAVGVLGAAGAVGAFLWTGREPSVGRLPPLSIQTTAELQLPPALPLSVARQLDTLFQDIGRARASVGDLPIEQVEGAPSRAARAPAAVNGASRSTPAAGSDQVAGASVVGPAPAPAAAVSINTQGPVEPKEVREALLRPPEREPNIMDLAKPAGRRQLERPADTGPGVYRIVARTDVLSRPTYRSYRVAILEVGDKIQVDEDMGAWLRLRSRNGRPGYILAQDAVRDSGR